MPRPPRRPRERQLAADERFIGSQDAATRAAAAASIAARLRARGLSLAGAYVAHRAALARLPHEARAAEAWRLAVAQTAAVIRG